MRIKGWQRVSLIDYPSKISTVVFIGGCNLYCPYCHNSDMISYSKGEIEFSNEEIFNFLDKRKGLIEGVVITGGEPTSSNGLYNFIRNIKERGYSVKLDTNGFFPKRLKNLIEKGYIDFVAMDVKNSEFKYLETVGKLNVDINKVKQSMDIIRNSGIDYEFRTTVVKEYHNKEDLIEIVDWIKGSKKWAIQQYHDSYKNVNRNLNPIDVNIINEIVNYGKNKIDKIELRGFSYNNLKVS